MKTRILARAMLLALLAMVVSACDGSSDSTVSISNLTASVSASRTSTSGNYTLQFEQSGRWVIYVGGTPRSIDYSQPAAFSGGEDITFDTSGENRRFFFDAFLNSGNALFSEFHIPLAGVDNTREFGGYEGAGGKFIAFCHLYRSGKLSGTTTDDLAYLNSMAISDVIDLRSESQIKGAPDVLPEGVLWHKYTLSSHIDFDKEITKVILGEADGYQVMIDFYSADIEESNIQSWIGVFDILEGGGPAMFHCSAGKDATGMTSVLLLSALGVDRETVIEDYTKSDIYLADWIEEQVAEAEMILPGGGERLRPMLEAKREYMETFLETVERQFGSMASLLRNVIHVDVKLLQNLYLR
ncbi:MAG: tyrosine-protein phosphatase [Deltaproteobacteria bacterium]|jgi:protein-tyrosine phosphatase|nr:tyrosine-protein phosphatase [Deltaproteobacteria bacterium]